jgi:hypothetical protein
MASLLLGGIGSGIGASIGGSFLGMSASSIGWMIGSTLGNLLFAEKQHVYGPRLKGDRFSGSALGQVRPIVYGTCKVEGKIIWQTPYHEHEHTEDSGGKGGGTEYTTYTYTRSFAVLLAEGEIEAVRRIWINGKLEYDWSETANVGADMESGVKAGSIKIYYGSNTQLPDPTIESFDGAGNVPAYRGSAYIVFNEYDVTDAQGACPLVEVEIVSNATDATASALGTIISYDDSDGDNWGGIGYINEGVVYYHVETSNAGGDYSRINGIDVSSGNVVYTLRLPNINAPTGVQRGAFTEDTFNYYVLGSDFFGGSPFNECATVSTFVKLLDGSIFALNSAFLLNTDLTPAQVANYGGWRDQGTLEKFTCKRGGSQAYIFATSVNANPNELRWVQRWSMPSALADARYDFVDGSYHLSPPYASNDGNVYVYCEIDHSLYILDIDLDLIEVRALPVSVPIPNAIAVENGIYWSGRSLAGASGNGIVEAYNLSDFSYIGGVSNLSYGASVRVGRTYSMRASGTSCAVTIDDKLWTVSTRRITRQSVALSEIVADLHQRSGQTTDDYDVAALTDDVRGYLITEQVSARSCIEQLQIAFLFDAKDSEGKIKYVKRGSASLATLSSDDLGAFETEPVSEWRITRQQEEELPQTLSIVYMDFDGSYEKAAQNATRQAVLAGDVTTFQVPIVFTADEAQSVAQKQQMAAWVGRTKYKFTTNMEWVKLEPCDVVTVQDKVIRLTSRADGVNGIIEFEGVAELPAIYTNTGVGSIPDAYGDENLEARGPTVFEILDLPPLRDGDYNQYVAYIAASGVLSGWPSAAIMKSSDGQSYSLLSLVNTASKMGVAETALSDWTGGNIFDEKNTVDIKMYGNSTLASVTRDEALAGDFCILLGNEIIFARTATLIATSRYRLSGLLRGRFGTEHETDSHAVNERFVVLSASTLRAFQPTTAELNVERYYKGVTSQNKISAAIAKAYTYTGITQKPYSPVNIGGGVSGLAGDWTIKWVRRSRYRGAWLDSYDVPLDEAAESYEIRIMNGSSVKRTLTSSTNSVTYTYAQQLTDWSTFKFSIDVQIRQIGAYGNSEWASETITAGFSTFSVLLMNMEGANLSTAITDQYGHTVSVFGDAKISTAVTAAGDLLLDGTGDYLTIPDSPEWDFPGEFTIEAMVYRAVTGVEHTIASNYQNSANGWSLEVQASNKATFNFTGDGADLTSTSNIAATTYTHIAVTRDGSNLVRLFVAGTQEASTTIVGSSSSTQALHIGRLPGFSVYFNGRIKWLRITKGQARYTANFTPPSGPFTE